MVIPTLYVKAQALLAIYLNIDRHPCALSFLLERTCPIDSTRIGFTPRNLDKRSGRCSDFVLRLVLHFCSTASARDWTCCTARHLAVTPAASARLPAPSMTALGLRPLRTGAVVGYPNPNWRRWPARRGVWTSGCCRRRPAPSAPRRLCDLPQLAWPRR